LSGWDYLEYGMPYCITTDEEAFGCADALPLSSGKSGRRKARIIGRIYRIDGLNVESVRLKLTRCDPVFGIGEKGEEEGRVN
jgi:hypothetical protein